MSRVEIFRCILTAASTVPPQKRFRSRTVARILDTPSVCFITYQIRSKDSESALRKLKPGAPLLVYLYYAFDNRPAWFRMAWRVSDIFRRFISALPFAVRSALCELIAALVYWPLARAAKWLERAGGDVDLVPLSSYRNRSFYSMRTDALDRFGTRLERRFTRKQINDMMKSAGFERIVFSESPCWCALGYRGPE